MFRKKHSEINIEMPRTTYSPFRKNNRSPLVRTPDHANLSPMKAKTKNVSFYTKSPRKQLVQQVYSIRKSPIKRQINFQSQLETLGNTILAQNQSIFKFSNNKSSTKVANERSVTTFANISNCQASDRNMNQSKKVFTNVISKMNSEKKTTDFSNKNSVFSDSKQIATDYPFQAPPLNSFKALKQIKMIESVQPLPSLLIQKSASENKNTFNNHILEKKTSCKQASKNTSVFTEETNIAQPKVEEISKKQKIIELINQSFSIHPSQQKPFEQVLLNQCQISPLDKNITQIFKSFEVQQSSELIFNTILLKLENKHETKMDREQEQLVKMSLESVKDDLSMDPFL